MPTGQVVFTVLAPGHLYIPKDSGPVALSIITLYTTDAHQPCMNWNRQQWKKLHSVAENTSGTVQYSGQWTVGTLTSTELSQFSEAHYRSIQQERLQLRT